MTRRTGIVLWVGDKAVAAVRYLHTKDFHPYPFILLNDAHPRPAQGQRR